MRILIIIRCVVTFEEQKRPDFESVAEKKSPRTQSKELVRGALEGASSGLYLRG